MVRGVSEGNLFWFLELRGFETVSNGFLSCAMFACQVNFCGLMICYMHIPSDEKRVSEGVLPMVRRLDLREKQCLLLSLVGV